jgi:hypothetical protein
LRRVTSCPCGHARWRAPETRDQALELAYHHNAIRHLLEEVARDSSRWLAVMRCRSCGRHWVEDYMSSGHADLAFIYPVDTGDPQRWLAEHTPLNPY